MYAFDCLYGKIPKFSLILYFDFVLLFDDGCSNLSLMRICYLIRYTKALEVIKKLHKDQAQEIKTYKLQLENLQTKKDIAYKVLLVLSLI